VLPSDGLFRLADQIAGNRFEQLLQLLEILFGNTAICGRFALTPDFGELAG
jgi:hypothetical protein